MTYDSLPIIDRSPKFENVFIVAGHNMLGLSMAPATGKLVAEMVNGSRPTSTRRPIASADSELSRGEFSHRSNRRGAVIIGLMGPVVARGGE